MTETQTNKRPASLHDFLVSQQPTVQTKRIDMMPAATEQAPQMGTDANSGLPKMRKPQASDQEYAAKSAVKIDNKNFVEPFRSQSVQMDPEKLNPGLAFSPAAITNQNKLQVKSDAQTKAD